MNEKKPTRQGREYEDVYVTSTPRQQNYRRGHKPMEQREVIYPNKFIEFMCKNDKKNTKVILICLLVFLVLFIVGSVLYLKYVRPFKNSLNQMIGQEELFSGYGDEDYTEDPENFEEEQFDAMHEVTNAASLDDLLKKWHNNGGELMRQDYVINVLLVGIDGKNGVKNGGNSDSLILVSINKKTETITMVSFMRDSRSYFEVNGKGYWAKVNAAYARGGAAATVKTLENDYKIDIDYFVAVDFGTFPKVIDALGGVEVEVKQYEQEYINRTTHVIKKIPNYGKVRLDGAQALVYSRIRHSDADSDVSRTRRQRTVIEALIKSAKGATKGQLLNAIDKLLPNLGTDCSKDEVVKYGMQALSQDWMDYKMEQLTMPDEDCRKDAMIDGQSLWVVDYPLAAQKVQTALYGTTNIELSPNRVTAFAYVRNNSGYTSGRSSTSQAGTTYAYVSPSASVTKKSEETESTTRWSLINRTTTAPAENDDDRNTDVEKTTKAPFTIRAPGTTRAPETTKVPETTKSQEE